MTNSADLASWANVVATALGSIGSTGALIVAYRLLRRESERDRLRDVESQLSQANAVAAWTSRSTLTLKNGGDLPVYDVLLEFRHAGPATYEVQVDYLVALPPGATVTRRLPGAASRRYLFVSMMFRDASGRRWTRTSKGEIHPAMLPGITDEPDRRGARSRLSRFRRRFSEPTGVEGLPSAVADPTGAPLNTIA
ncbi:hypothetical protein [Dactylosporangium sp. CA-139066]|uniref:hypothetical protein n=1 Tax=Dactylosporangium sp. CA-139066 TaxID=3239930 RepID=UPI003D8EEF23